MNDKMRPLGLLIEEMHLALAAMELTPTEAIELDLYLSSLRMLAQTRVHVPAVLVAPVDLRSHPLQPTWAVE